MDVGGRGCHVGEGGVDGEWMLMDVAVMCIFAGGVGVGWSTSSVRLKQLARASHIFFLHLGNAIQTK